MEGHFRVTYVISMGGSLQIDGLRAEVQDVDIQVSGAFICALPSRSHTWKPSRSHVALFRRMLLSANALLA